jgi:hypothetical protein
MTTPTTQTPRATLRCPACGKKRWADIENCPHCDGTGVRADQAAVAAPSKGGGGYVAGVGLLIVAKILFAVVTQNFAIILYGLGALVIVAALVAGWRLLGKVR